MKRRRQTQTQHSCGCFHVMQHRPRVGSANWRRYGHDHRQANTANSNSGDKRNKSLGQTTISSSESGCQRTTKCRLTDVNSSSNSEPKASDKTDQIHHPSLTRPNQRQIQHERRRIHAAQHQQRVQHERQRSAPTTSRGPNRHRTDTTTCKLTLTAATSETTV